MESWRLVWRDGFAKVLSTAGLRALLTALESDDPRLTQGSSTTPPPLMCAQDWPVEAADAIGFAGWQGDGLTTVGGVGEHFAVACFQADQLLGDPAACRFFLSWFDNTPRPEMRRELAHEVKLVLMARGSVSEALGVAVPDGFSAALAASGFADTTTLAVLADWLDDHDHGPQAKLCRDAAGVPL